MITLPFLLEWTLRSSALILAAALLLRALRVKDPAVLLAAWTAMLCGSMAMPALTAALPGAPVGIVRGAERIIAGPPTIYTAEFEPFVPRPSAATPRPHVSHPFALALAVVILYTAIAGALLLRLGTGVALSLRLLRGSRPAGRTAEGIEIRESNRISSPAAVGIVRAAIVLPAGWREWEQVKLDAVIAHERSHIRRRDPAVQLLSAIHRALLWHNPLSWFLHRRIVRLAEEASDDAAVAAACDRAAYAEVLLEFMQRGTRKVNWQGVPMARYGRPEERIHRILDSAALSRGVTLWSAAAILAIGAPLSYLAAAVQAGPAQVAVPSTDARLAFDAASVKPVALSPLGGGEQGETTKKSPTNRRDSGGPGTNDPGRIHYGYVTLKTLLLRAYGVQNFQVEGPGWLDTERFEVDATMPPETTGEQFGAMLRTLLAERFKLAVHRESKELAGYALGVAKNGPKIKESAQPAAAPDDAPDARPQRDAEGFLVPPRRPGGFFQLVRGPAAARWTFQQTTMQTLASELQIKLNRPVADATGLAAKYDFALTLSTEGIELGSCPIAVAGGTVDAPPDIFGALQSQAGLKLESKRALAAVIVVDHAEKAPGGN